MFDNDLRKGMNDVLDPDLEKAIAPHLQGVWPGAVKPDEDEEKPAEQTAEA
jgi:hypothetical protein